MTTTTPSCVACNGIDATMVSSCCVWGCTTESADSKEKGICFFRFPKCRKQRIAWIKAINRKEASTGSLWEPGPSARVCSQHFEGGWQSDDPKDANYRPTLLLKHVKPVPTSRSDGKKAKKRKQSKVSNVPRWGH